MKFAEYKEKKTHGSESFPLQYYLVDREHPQYEMPLHWHNEFEILRVREGALTLYLNNEEHRVKAGEVAFIGPCTLHRGIPVACVYECLVFDLRMIAGYPTTRVSDLIKPVLSADTEITPFCPAAAEPARQLFDVIVAEEPYFELKAASLIADVVCHLYSVGAIKLFPLENKRLAHRRAVMTLLIDKIEREYTRKITLAELAEMTQINEKYLCRFFREFTGQTPIDYINRLRIERACFEMSVNKLNVTEAAFECGFNELSYFSKTFKRYKGISPGAYKSRLAVKEESEA